MKRLQVRYSVLTVLWVSVGLILFAVLWALLRGKSDATGGIAGIGALLFVVSGALYGSEVHMAIRAANLRVDDGVRERMALAAEVAATKADLAAIERHLGMTPPAGPDVVPRLDVGRGEMGSTP